MAFIPENDNYKQYPALAGYIDRIGARQLNFRRFMVKIFRGDVYYHEKCLITINLEDRTIDCDNPDFDPSELERDQIAEELARMRFPLAIEAETIEGLRRKIKKEEFEAPDDKLFIMYNRATGKIKMVQHRTKDKSGNKIYVPWCCFDDGEWRSMEPEGALPFWKPLKKHSNQIMVHEGAKAAFFCDWLTRSDALEAREARKVHPWAEELARFEHWGILGGALAPRRANYSELRAEKPDLVVYVADNDSPGRAVAQQFSRFYHGPMRCIQFDTRWPTAWDMADPLPESFWSGKGEGRIYRGPDIDALMKPATWATEVFPNPYGAGRPITALRTTFAEEWYHSIQPELFIHRDNPSNPLADKEFNSLVAPFSHVDDVAKLLRKEASNKVMRLHYAPDAPPGLSGTVELGQFINTFSDSKIKPKKGDAGPWLEFMERLIPAEKDRHEVMRWCATLVAKPATKMAYGILMVSETQGVGKTTLGEKILAPLVGLHNVSAPSERDIVESQFNAWIAHKRLAIVNEIYAGSSTKAYNNLKSVITDAMVTVNKKHQSTYEVQNWLHVFACSNSMRALKIAFEDRRWLVPKITEEVSSNDYWKTLNAWLKNGGLEIIKHWAGLWLLDNRAVLPGETAPNTDAKTEMIEENFSRGMIVAAALFDAMRKASARDGKEYFTTDIAIVKQIQERVFEGKNSPMLEKPITVRRVAKARGLSVGEERSSSFSPFGAKARLIATNPSLARRLQEGLKKEGLIPFDFNEIKEEL